MKKGSDALMVWVKETATLPRLMLVNTVPSMCPKASGAILPNCSRKSCRHVRNQQAVRSSMMRWADGLLTCAAESLGAGWSLVAHMRKMSREPKASWKAVIVYGSGNGSAPRTCNGERRWLLILNS